MSAWYEQSFGKDYLTVYKHRDFQGAYQEVKQMIEWLKLPNGAHILDLCCGMGRHSMALTDFGYHVTGIDLSDVLLNEAKESDPQNRVRWIKADMRDIPLNENFDSVLNLFTSFGYFETNDENIKVLKEMDRVLKPSGKFIIDFLNAAYVKEHLVPYSERFTDGVTIEESRSIEESYVKKRIVIKEVGQPERRYLEQVRLYGLDEFKSLLEETKLQIDHVYGDYNQSPYNEGTSPRLIIVGNKIVGIKE